MTFRRDRLTARSYLLQGTLLLLPLLAIVAVFRIASVAVRDLDRLTPRQEFAASENYLGSVRFDVCLKDLKQKAGTAGQVPIAEIDNCIRNSASAPSMDDQIKSKIDELKWMLTMIGSIGAFFVIAQSAAAFFSALLYTRQAETTLAEIANIQDGVLARYPVFRAVEEQRGLALIDLAQVVKISSQAEPGTDPLEVLDYEYKDTLYSRMSVKKRQELLSIESFASIDLDPGPLGGDSYADNLRRLAFFYQSKFQYEKDAGFGSLSDLERAEGYLRLAIEKAQGDFTINNDLGVVCLDVLKAIKATGNNSLECQYRTAARDAFEVSLRCEPRQMRAHYNLSILAARYGGAQDGEQPIEAKSRSYRDAIICLEQTVHLMSGGGNWQRTPAGNANKALIFYNIGCYKAWLIGADPACTNVLATDANALEVLKYLHAAARLGGIAAKVVTKDFNFSGTNSESDIVSVYNKMDGALKLKFDHARDLLLANARTPPARPTKAEAIKETLKLVKRYKKLRSNL